MINIEKIQNFYKNNSLNLNEKNIDYNLFDLFVNSRDEINDLVLDVINHGDIRKQISLKFNYKDTIETQFILIEKKSLELSISVIIKIINENNLQIVSSFPTVKCNSYFKTGCYFPDEVEIFGRIKSAVGLSETDVFDTLVLFEREYFEDDNSDDVEWNIFGIAYSNINGEKNYNDFDGVDNIYPYRKIKIQINGIESVMLNGILFYKCFTDAALFSEYELDNPEIMNMKIPIYISEKIISNVEELYNGKEMNAIIFGNIKTV